MDLDDKLMEETAYGKAALRTFGRVSENFRIYYAGLLGVHPNYHGMEVKGAEFRRAKTGPNKGSLCIKVPGTERTAYVSSAAMRRAEKRLTPSTAVPRS